MVIVFLLFVHIFQKTLVQLKKFVILYICLIFLIGKMVEYNKKFLQKVLCISNNFTTFVVQKREKRQQIISETIKLLLLCQTIATTQSP